MNHRNDKTDKNDKTVSRIRCHICNLPVDLTADIAADEEGQTVHERCYVKQLTVSKGGSNHKSVKGSSAKTSKLRGKSAKHPRKHRKPVET
jgi:hypothetical protein